MPSISVLMPVYNPGAWLDASLRSLWRQSDADFEVIAIDDGSTDGAAETLDRAARSEPRLRVLRSPHLGLPRALNLGLAQARGALIARHDADDLSHRRRFERQRAALGGRPDLAVVGSRLRMFPAAATGAGMRRWAAWHNGLLEHDAIANEALIDSPLAHGTAMIRREWLERVGGWQERGWPEDLDLWVRLLRSGARFAKVPETLYGWRQHRGSATRCDARYRRERFVDLKREALSLDFVRDHPRVTLVGVGASLARAGGALRELGVEVLELEAGMPGPDRLPALRPPAILVFMSPRVRERWRDALARAGWIERADFIFVA